MTEAAELRAVDFPVACHDGRKPDRNRLSGNRVLLDAHLDQAEAVNHVFAAEVNNDGLVYRQNQLVDRGDVVLGRGIRSIDSERIVGTHELRIDAAKLPVSTRV